jgi:hypothetical protein
VRLHIEWSEGEVAFVFGPAVVKLVKYVKSERMHLEKYVGYSELGTLFSYFYK